MLHGEGLDAYVVRRLNLPFRDVDWTAWDELLRRVHHPSEEVTVALVGKYIDLPDAYLSVTEALRAGGFAHDAKVNIGWVASDDCETPTGRARQLADVDAICVPGGFGIRGIEGKLGALAYARTHGIPTLGLCLGLQCMVIEYARNVAGLEKADSTEFDPDCPQPVIATMAEQDDVRRGRGRPRRHDAPRASTRPTCRGLAWSAQAYGADQVDERHRHRYEVNNGYRGPLEDGRPGLLRHVAGRPPGRVRRAARATCTRTTSPPRRTRSSGRARPGRTRCSPVWSARRSPGSASSGSRSTSPGCAARPPTTTTRADGAQACEDLRDEPVEWPVARSTDLYRGDWVLALRADDPERARSS